MQYVRRREIGTQVQDECEPVAEKRDGDLASSETRDLYAKLVRESAGSLMAFLRASVNDRAGADDLFQETMLIAWRRFEDYDCDRPFGAWVRGIARRLVIVHYRQSGRQVPLENEKVIDYLDQRMAEIDRLPGDSFDERIIPLRECMESLAEKYSEAVKLHYSDGCSTNWIAKHQEITRDAVQKRLQRARSLLLKCLTRKGVLSRRG